MSNTINRMSKSEKLELDQLEQDRITLIQRLDSLLGVQDNIVKQLRHYVLAATIEVEELENTHG